MSEAAWSEAEIDDAIGYVEEAVSLPGAYRWPEEYRQLAFDTMIQLGQIALDINDRNNALRRVQPYRQIGNTSLDLAVAVSRKIPYRDYHRMNRQYRREMKTRTFREYSHQLGTTSRPGRIAEYLKAMVGQPILKEELARAIANTGENVEEIRQALSGIINDGHVDVRLAQEGLELHSKNIKVQDGRAKAVYLTLEQGTAPDWESIADNLNPRFWPRGGEPMPARYGRYVEWIAETFKHFAGRLLSGRDITKVCYAEEYDDNERVVLNRTKAYLSRNRNLWESRLLAAGFKTESFNIDGLGMFVSMPESGSLSEDEVAALSSPSDDELRELAIKLRAEESGKQPSSRGWAARRESLKAEPFWEGVTTPEVGRRNGMYSEWLAQIFKENKNRPMTIRDLSLILYAEKVDQWKSNLSYFDTNIRSTLKQSRTLRHELEAARLKIVPTSISQGRFSSGVVCVDKSDVEALLAGELLLGPKLTTDELRQIAIELREQEAAEFSVAISEEAPELDPIEPGPLSPAPQEQTEPEPVLPNPGATQVTRVPQPAGNALTGRILDTTKLKSEISKDTQVKSLAIRTARQVRRLMAADVAEQYKDLKFNLPNQAMLATLRDKGVISEEEVRKQQVDYMAVAIAVALGGDQTTQDLLFGKKAETRLDKFKSVVRQELDNEADALKAARGGSDRATKRRPIS